MGLSCEGYATKFSQYTSAHILCGGRNRRRSKLQQEAFRAISQIQPTATDSACRTTRCKPLYPKRVSDFAAQHGAYHRRPAEIPKPCLGRVSLWQYALLCSIIVCYSCQISCECSRPDDCLNLLWQLLCAVVGTQQTNNAVPCLCREVSHNSIQHRTPTLMLQLESEQDSEQLHTETKSDIPSRCAAASNSAPLQAIAQQPADMAQCSDSAPCDLLQLSNASPAASAADDASRSAQPGWQGVHLLHHNRFATPISKLANMLQHQHGKHAQLLPMTGSNAYSHPNDAPNIQQPAHQAGMPASLQHILPQHLTRLQLQNLHRAAEILSSPVQGRASIRQESSPKDKVSAEAGAAAVGAAEAAAKATIANKSEQALTTAVGCDTQHDPAADAAGHAIPSHQAVHELATCGASRDAFQTACSPRQCSVLRLQSPAVHCDQDDPQDAIAALLDSKLDRMAPALCCLYIDTLCVRHPSTHAAEASQRCSSNPPKRSFSAMQVTAASLPQAEAALTSRPETIDTKVPGHVHGKCECCANSGALVAPSTEEVRTCVQRKRFRKTTGLEVLYRTRPLVCAQLYPIGIPS